MRDFPSCFGENGVQVADASCPNATVSKACQNSVTCVYRCKLLGKSCLVSILWSKNLMGQGLTVSIDDSSHQCICKVDVKTSLFSKRKGSKCFESNSSKIEVFWDLSVAKFGSGPEPISGYYVAIVCKGHMVLMVGDLRKEAFKKTGVTSPFSTAVFISKKEHICGKKVYSTKTQFCDNGPIHDLKIECDPNCNDDPSLVVRIDSKPVLKIKHLQWKFRGNCTFIVDGLSVEAFWDVHNWMFGQCVGNAVFMFQTNLSTEKLWSSSSPSISDSAGTGFSWSCCESFRESKPSGLGFSLFLYAWKNE